MLLTISVIILVIGLFIEGFLRMKNDKQVSNNQLEIDLLHQTLKQRDAEFQKAVKSLSNRLENTEFRFEELRSKTQSPLSDELLGRIANTEKSVNNLYSDLDRIVGTVDQIQHRVEEMQVLIENAINEFRR